MNQLFVLLILLSQILQSDSDVDKYPVKSGKIVYQYEGRNSCNEVIYFDDYGDLYYDLKISSKIENGKLVKCSKLKILHQDTVLTFDTESNKESRCVVVDYSVKVKQNIISDEMLHEMGYSLSGMDEVSGIVCSKYTCDDSIMWVWNNIILKSEIEIMDIKIKMEAVEVVTGIDIDPSIFRLSADYKLIK